MPTKKRKKLKKRILCGRCSRSLNQRFLIYFDFLHGYRCVPCWHLLFIKILKMHRAIINHEMRFGDGPLPYTLKGERIKNAVHAS